MSLSQKAGTPRRRTQRAPARRANRHAAISFAAQRHFFEAGLTPAKPNRGKALEGPPADQRALRISTAPSTHLFRLNRRHALHHTPPARRPFRAHHRQAPFLSASPISFQRDTALHVKPSPGKSTFRPLFAPSAPQPPRSGRRPPFSQTVDRRSDASVCQSGAFTKTTAVYLHGKKINYLFRPGTFTGGSASGTRRRPVRKRCKPASRGKGRPVVQPRLILRR